MGGKKKYINMFGSFTGAIQLVMLCVFCAVAGLADENGVGQNAGQEAESQSNRK